LYKVKACITFSAAHRIAGHPRCGRIHGHNYRVCITVLESRVMEVDLDVLEEWLKRSVFERFDHQYLNELLGGGTELDSVTSEELAEIIAREFEKFMPGKLVEVEVCETDNLCVRYEPKGSRGIH